jgi:hypothetical protein
MHRKDQYPSSVNMGPPIPGPVEGNGNGSGSGNMVKTTHGIRVKK